jgi:hypothetical protein
MSTIEVNTIKPISGSSTITLGESGDTIALASGASQTIVSNTPAFKATMSSGQSVANDTTTRLAFNSLTNGFDTDSAFNTSTNKFTIPSGKAGKYYFNMMVRSGNITDTKKVGGYVMKNGVEIDPGQFFNVSSNGSEQYSVIVTALFEMSVGDYAVAKVIHQSGSASTFGTTGAVFQGFKLIE